MVGYGFTVDEATRRAIFIVMSFLYANMTMIYFTVVAAMFAVYVYILLNWCFYAELVFLFMTTLIRKREHCTISC